MQNLYKEGEDIKLDACIAHFHGMKLDFKSRFNDLIETNFPLWFTDLANFDPMEDENCDGHVSAELIEIKENKSFLKKLEAEGVAARLSVKQEYRHLYEIAFQTLWYFQHPT